MAGWMTLRTQKHEAGAWKNERLEAKIGESRASAPEADKDRSAVPRRLVAKEGQAQQRTRGRHRTSGWRGDSCRDDVKVVAHADRAACDLQRHAEEHDLRQGKNGSIRWSLRL